jgi:ATP-dependent Clp protease ATP-binding subunit ClpA
MNYNFTDRVRKVLAMAREEAIRLQHDYVGTEHILLALLEVEDGSGVLSGLGVDKAAAEEAITGFLSTSPGAPSAGR